MEQLKLVLEMLELRKVATLVIQLVIHLLEMLLYLAMDEHGVSIDDLLQRILRCCFDMGKGKLQKIRLTCNFFAGSRVCIEYFLIAFRKFMTAEQLVDYIISQYRDTMYMGIKQGYSVQ